MVQIHLFSMCLQKTFWLPLIKKKMGPLAFPWDKFRQVASWESLHFFPYSWEQISMPIWCFSRGLMEKGRMCAQPQALINWAHILLSFLFSLLKTGTIAGEPEDTLRTLDLSWRGVLAQYQTDPFLTLLRAQQQHLPPAPPDSPFLRDLHLLRLPSVFLPSAHQDAKRVGRWGGACSVPYQLLLPSLPSVHLLKAFSILQWRPLRSRTNPLGSYQVKGTLRLYGPSWDHRAIY